MALITAQPILQTGLQPVYTAVNASDTFVPPAAGGAAAFLHVKNGNAGACTVTVVEKAPCSFGSTSPTHDLSVSVPATTGDRMIGPIPAERYLDPTTGVATVTYSVTATVTAALVVI